MARTTGKASIADMLASAQIEVGERLVLNRRSGPSTYAKVEADGRIRMGRRIFRTPSAAATEALEVGSADGWLRWRVERLNGMTLADVRDLPTAPVPNPDAPFDWAREGLTLDALGGEPFGTLLADPPWRFMNRTGKVAPEHKRLARYDTMTTDDICSMPVADVMADRSHCYLWVPNAMLGDGLRVMEAWGFTYKANIVWAKRRKDGGPDGRGVGFYFRNVTEPILFGVRGKLRTLAPGRRQVNMIESQKREHSRKPDEQYPLIEACSPGPYLEMFCRYPQPGWKAWGNEAADHVVPRGKQYAAYGGNGNKSNGTNGHPVKLSGRTSVR